MAYKLPKQTATPPLLRIEPFKGMNLSVTPTQIDEHQSPDMLNMNIDIRGSLNKRTGYERILYKPIGTGQINGMYLYKKTDGTETFLFAHGTKLYKSDVLPKDAIKRLTTWTDDDLSKTWESEV